MSHLYLALALVGWITTLYLVQKLSGGELKIYASCATMFASAHFSATWINYMTGLSYEILFVSCAIGALSLLIADTIRHQKRLRRG